MQILVATSNQGKLAEIKALFGPENDFGILSLIDFLDLELPEETGDTFEENAALKAEAASKATGLVTIADDSGLCVDALGGAPGVRSARYAGDDATDERNWMKLLDELKDVPDEKRTAAFKCVIALSAPDKETQLLIGEVKGVIIYEPKGTNGFGYDPVFYYPPYSKTFAELTPNEKNAISHRAKALKQCRIMNYE